jgi:hypothetical protein
MHRRSFLGLLGLAPVMPLAAVATSAPDIRFEPRIDALSANLGDVQAGVLAPPIVFENGVLRLATAHEQAVSFARRMRDAKVRGLL